MKIKEKHIRWTGIPLVGLLTTFLIKHNNNDPFIYNLAVSVFFTFVLWNGTYYILCYFRGKIPHLNQTAKRLTITIFCISIFLIIGAIILRIALGYNTITDFANWRNYFKHSEVNFVIATIACSIYEGAYFFSKWKETFQLNEALKNQQIRTQFEVLQNQMSPHFLFNSLNTLTTLIAEDRKVAIEFTQKMSDVYRYILQNKERELVELEEELTFAKDYLYLLQMRYPENLKATFTIDKKYLKQHIAPLTIQMLIENAVKHNVVSHAHPLYIEIYVENGYSIVVKNNLQVKSVIQKSTKTGLDNIKKRYQYFGNKPVDIITTTKNFLVAIPLINLVEDNQTSDLITS